MKKKRLVIVDDHPVVRMGFRQMLEQEQDFEICGEAGSADEAIRLIQKEDPDLAILDLSLSDRSGVELIKQLKSSDGGPKILVCSMHDETVFAERSLKAGASGYIEKEEAAGELIGAVRKVLAGGVYLSPEMTQHMLQVAVGTDPAEGAVGVDRLSDRELEVFGMVGQGKTTREIADSLHLSVKTIESHRENIKAKLALENNNELIHRAVEWWLRQA